MIPASIMRVKHWNYYSKRKLNTRFIRNINVFWDTLTERFSCFIYTQYIIQRLCHSNVSSVVFSSSVFLRNSRQVCVWDGKEEREIFDIRHFIDSAHRALWRGENGEISYIVIFNMTCNRTMKQYRERERERERESHVYKYGKIIISYFWMQWCKLGDH